MSRFLALLGDPSPYDLLILPGTVPGNRRDVPASPAAAERVPSLGALAVLREGLRVPRGGETVVCSGEASGRIYLHAGRISWVYASSRPGSLAERLRRWGVAAEALEGAIGESQRTGRCLSDVMVSLSLVCGETMRGLLRAYLAERLQALLAPPDLAALFVRRARAVRGPRVGFTLDELLAPEAARPPLERTPTAPRWPSASVRAAGSRTGGRGPCRRRAGAGGRA